MVGAGELGVGRAHERLEAFQHADASYGQGGSCVRELAVEHLEGAGVVGVAHAGAEQRVALTEYAVVVAADRRVPWRGRDE